jgi:hypothetical protein
MHRLNHRQTMDGEQDQRERAAKDEGEGTDEQEADPNQR